MAAREAQPRPRGTPMQVTQPTEQRQNMEKHERETLNDLIGEQVIHTLGKPGDLLKVQVRPLWENHFRVNVFVGVDAASAKVAHSFFLVTGHDGNILVSAPNLTRHY
jgi:hypothetical protein